MSTPENNQPTSISPADSRFWAETEIEPLARLSATAEASSSNNASSLSWNNASSPGRWKAEISAAWNIGENANGGYALTPVLRAMSELSGLPDPLSVTTHFFRPTEGDCEAEITAEVIRSGRSFTTLTGRLEQRGKQKIEVMALLGDLAKQTATTSTKSAAAQSSLAPPPPELPPPDQCVPRSAQAQGLTLPLLDRVEVRVDPRYAEPGQSSEAVTEGWIRFRDQTPPTAMALPFFCDAFPPSVFSLLGMIGWVPTLELTVHTRGRPAPGWLRGRFASEDLQSGLFVESGQLWDSTGALVAQSRQLALLLT